VRLTGFGFASPVAQNGALAPPSRSPHTRLRHRRPGA
jgi:hypothetical protein